MRLTGGMLSGRTFAAPDGMETRPTTDRVREALFNILAHRDWGDKVGDPFEKALVLDAFCGTGALAFESLSRGASQAFLFDKGHAALQVARANATKLGVQNACHFFAHDVTHPPLTETPCTLLFFDPPYKKDLVPLSLKALFEKKWIATNALIVIETSKKEELVLPSFCDVALERAYGDTLLRFAVMND